MGHSARRGFARRVSAALFLLLQAAALADVAGNPLLSVIELLEKMRRDVIQDGIMQDEAYRTYKRWCETQTAVLAEEIEEAKKEKDSIEAGMFEAETSMDAATVRIEQFADRIAKVEVQLKLAQDARNKEVEVFTASAKELMSAIESMKQALQLLEEERKKKSGNRGTFGAFVQEETVTAEEARHVSEVLMGLAAIVDSASLQSRNAEQLAALLQGRNELQTSGEFVYERHAGVQDVVDLIKQLLDETRNNLHELQSKEREAKQAFDLLSLSLSDQMENDKKNSRTEQKKQQDAKFTKADLESKISGVTELHETAMETQKASRYNCLQVAADQDTSESGRRQEIEALTEALRTIKKSSGLDGSQTSFLQLTSAKAAAGDSLFLPNAREMPLHHAAEFLQTDKVSEPADTAYEDKLPGTQMALGLLRRLAKKQHSVILAQVATKISLATKSASQEDGLEHVRKMVQDLIQKMQEEAAADMQEHTYCETEIPRSKTRIEILDNTIRTCQTDIDSATSSSVILKAEVDKLRAELEKLVQEQVELTRSMEDLDKVYQSSKADLERGLEGVRAATETLRKYYGSRQSSFIQTALPKAHTSSSSLGSFVESQPNHVELTAVALMEASMGMESPGSPQNFPDETSESKEMTASSSTATDVAVADASQGDDGDGSRPEELRAIYNASSQLQKSAGLPPQKPSDLKADVGASVDVIGILEACEADFAQNLAELETQANDNKAEQVDLMAQNKRMQKQNERAVKHKTEELTSFDAEVRKHKRELNDAKNELDPLLQFLAELKEHCEKKGTQEELTRRRQQEIDGLQEALAVLHSSGLLQVAARQPALSFLQQRKTL